MNAWEKSTWACFLHLTVPVWAAEILWLPSPELLTEVKSFPDQCFQLSISRHARAGWEKGKPEHLQYLVHIFDVFSYLHILCRSQPERDNFVTSSLPGWQPLTVIYNSLLTKPDTFCFTSYSHWAYHFTLLESPFPVAVFSWCILCSLSPTNNWPTNYLLFSPLLDSLVS